MSPTRHTAGQEDAELEFVVGLAGLLIIGLFRTVLEDLLAPLVEPLARPVRAILAHRLGGVVLTFVWLAAILAMWWSGSRLDEGVGVIVFVGSIPLAVLASFLFRSERSGPGGPPGSA